MLSFRFLILLLIPVCSPFVGAAIRPSTHLTIVSGEGFLAYLEVPKGFGEIKNCWFKYRGKNYLLSQRKSLAYEYNLFQIMIRSELS